MARAPKYVWRRGGDSNPRYVLRTHAFQACSLSHSDTSPGVGKSSQHGLRLSDSRARPQNSNVTPPIGGYTSRREPARADFPFVAGHPSLDFLNTRPVVRTAARRAPVHSRGLRPLAGAGGRAGRRAPPPTPCAAGAAAPRAPASPSGPGASARRSATWSTGSSRAGACRPRAWRRSTSSSPRTTAACGSSATAAASAPASSRGRRSRSRCSATSPSPRRTCSAARDPHLIRRCGNPDCVLYFYDATRNHRRQWCAMATCGNLMKVRAFRRRHRRRTLRRRRFTSGDRPAPARSARSRPR